MNELFDLDQQTETGSSPLADRMRPKKLTDIEGQEHLAGSNGIITKYIKSGNVPSMIFWGPPGVGKTTLAFVIANELEIKFTALSAVEVGVKEVRAIISEAERFKKSGRKSMLFIDEIHRFNKSQQDALLHAVEKGILILTGATTENPSFEVNSALLSRCRVYKLNPLSEENIINLINRTLKNDKILSKFNIRFEYINTLVELSGGDARTALNILEAAFNSYDLENSQDILITNNNIEKVINSKVLIYDKSGENHYDVISAFIKSMRGSDPDAALFWMARMLESGEDPKFIARRMLVFASEDVGNADPNALIVANAVFQAVTVIGMPECIINLAQGVTYLASAPKSNASYQGIMAALEDIRSGIDTTVPLKLRNAPTKLMKDEGYAKDYKYPHDFPEHFVDEHYFPDKMKHKTYYNPTDIAFEAKFKTRLERIWKKKYE